MSDSALVDQATFRQWISAKHKPTDIEEELLSNGFETDAIKANLKEYKRLLIAKRNFTGFLCMGIGAFIGFISCVLAVINPMPALHNFFLFGLTTVAVFIVFIGLYFVFE